MVPEYSVAFWFLAIAAVLLFGISKAGFGTGVGILATPLLTLAIPVTDAVAILLPLLIITDFFSVYYYRLNFHRPSIRVLLPAAIIGIAIGAFFFGAFRGNQRILQISMGILALSFVLFQILRALVLGVMEASRPKTIAGILLGAMSGFISTVAHAGGPPVAVYLLPQKLPRQLFVGTTVIFFTAVNLVKLVPYQMLGLFSVGNMATVLMLAPMTYVGVRLGIYLNRRFTDMWFNRVIYALLFLTGIQLVLGRSLMSMLFGG
ncbi:MAG: sulfite exporter TauE/SafE family protein [Deltaproteobacteria bacterium]|nr:sulfite exporter TauE/SafE family protein [Deltaproteobacteria bacterium]